MIKNVLITGGYGFIASNFLIYLVRKYREINFYNYDKLLYCASENWVINGDMLFAGSIGRTDLPGSNHDDMLTSLREKIVTLPDDTKVYCGHGIATTIKNEKATNPYLLNL